MLLFFKSNKLTSLFFSIMVLIIWLAYSIISNLNIVNLNTIVNLFTIIGIGALYHLNLNAFKNIEKQKNIFLFLFCIFQLNTTLFTQELSNLTCLFTLVILLIALKSSGILSTHFAFISSFIIGFLTLLDPKSIIYISLVYTAYIIKTQFSFRYIIIIIIGFTTPFFFYYSLAYFNQQELPNLTALMLPELSFKNFSLKTIYSNDITTFFYLSISIVSIFLGFKNFNKNNVKERKNMTYILVFILVNIFYILIGKNSTIIFDSFQTLIINKSLLTGYLLINIKNKWYSELFFILIITIEVLNLFI